MESELEIDVFTGGVAMTNGYLLNPGEGKPVVVIDAPEGVTSWLRDRGVKVEALLLTHLHYDHVIDVAPLKEQFGCPVYAFSQPNDDLTLKSVMATAFGMEWIVPDFEVDHLLENEKSVRPATEFKFDLLHVPGHSPDSLCFKLRGSELLFGGDVLFQGGYGRTDLPHGNKELLFSEIREKILTLPEETIVFPGHGALTTVGEEKASNYFLR